MPTPASPELSIPLAWRHVPRAVGIAFDPRKLFLGALGLVLLWAGQTLISALPFGPLPVQREVALSGLSQEQSQWLKQLIGPVESILVPARVIFQNGNSCASLGRAWTQLLWAVCVWSLIGGAITRMAALQFARHERVGIRAALRFSARQFLSYLIAPALALSGLGCVAGFLAGLGWIGSLVPSVADTVLGAMWGLFLLLGFLMAMLAVGLSLGWPLMIAAISTEDSDGFDGLSRSFGFLYDRPWHAGALVVSMAVVGSAGLCVLRVIFALTASLAGWSVTAGFADLTTPTFVEYLEPDRFSGISFGTSSNSGGAFADNWLGLLSLLVMGYGPSFFWSATTVIYFLLRQSDDGTPLNDVNDVRTGMTD